jgi:mono/diheme cytochrome c family protein
MLLALLLVVIGGLGCRQDMHDAPSYSPLEASEFFDDGTSARQPVEGTVARGQLRDDEHLFTGRGGDGFATTFPFAIGAADLERGHERFDVFCSPCHDRTGAGNGMVMQRGFRRKSPSLHDERLRTVPPGYIFDVITNGYGAMLDYSSQIPAEDRWRIVAYVRALQLSQNAAPDDVPADQREFLSAAGRTAPEGH